MLVIAQDLGPLVIDLLKCICSEGLLSSFLISAAIDLLVGYVIDAPNLKLHKIGGNKVR